jgi:hypothetical protein
MSRFCFICFCTVISLYCNGQVNKIDSLKLVLSTEKVDTAKAIILYNLSNEYQNYKPDSALIYAQEAYDLSVKHNFLKGQSWALNQMAGAFNRLDNYTKALEYYLEQLKIVEKIKNTEALAIINMNIALVYSSENDIDNALFYILKSDSIIKKNNLQDLSIYSLLNIGDIYEKANKFDLALKNTTACYELAVTLKDSVIMGISLTNLGNINSKLSNYTKAIQYYYNSFPLLASQQDNLTLSECYWGLSKAYLKTNNNDSALHFASLAYTMANQNGFIKTALDASSTLSLIYKNNFQFDSAFAFQEIMIGLKDSLENKKKVKLIESISLQEKLRQNNMAAQAIKDKKENQQKLQLLAIGIFIPIFFLTSMYLSRKKVPKKFIEFAGILSLLLLFEYITLFIHPFVAEITHHSPFLEIIIFVCIGALFIPAHHRIEHWFIKKLTNIHQKHTQNAVVTELAVNNKEIENDLNEEIATSIEQTIVEENENITTNQSTEKPNADLDN